MEQEPSEEQVHHQEDNTEFKNDERESMGVKTGYSDWREQLPRVRNGRRE